MRKFFAITCLFAGLFLVGCGKRSKKNDVRVVAENAIEKEQIIPVYQFEADEFFDDKEVTEYAFMDGEEVSDEIDEAPVSNTLASASNSSSCDDWDNEKLSLAWEREDKDLSFKVVRFDLNKNEIRDDQKESVAENVKVANKAVELGKDVVVSGHCCPLGSESYNLSLSERRAKAIRDEMVKEGVPAERIRIVGFGSQCLVVTSDAIDRKEQVKALALNRRAEVELK